MENEYKVGKHIFFTTLKTLIVLVVILVFASLGLYVINPKLSAKIANRLNFRHLEVSCLEFAYTRSKSNADLYNLIVKLGGIQKYTKQNEYISRLKSSKDYGDFCENLDSSVKQNFLSGNISAQNASILYGTNEYLTSRYIVNLLIGKNFDAAREAAVKSLETDRNQEVCIYYYVDYMYTKNISAERRKADFDQICQTVIDKLETKQNAFVEGDQPFDKIVLAYANLKIEYTRYILYLVTEQTDQAESAFTAWQKAQQTYQQLI